MSKQWMAALAAAAAVLAAGQASATIYHLTYSGQVTQALDFSTADGPSFLGPAASLVGQAFTANVVFDNAAPNLGDSSNSFSDLIYAPTMTTAAITIGSHTFSLGATSGSDYRADYRLEQNCMGNCDQGTWVLNATNETLDPSDIYTLQYINLFAQGQAVAGLAHTAPDYTNPPVQLGAFLDLFQQDQGPGPLDTFYDTEVNIRIDSITGGDRWSAGVPQPATWAMMLLGFSGLGAVLRGRRREGLAA